MMRFAVFLMLGLLAAAPMAQAQNVCGGRVITMSWMSEPAPRGFWYRVNVVGLTEVEVSAQVTLADGVPHNPSVQLRRGAHHTLVLGTGPTPYPAATLQASTRFTCR